jgi:hypothetical protein
VGFDVWIIQVRKVVSDVVVRRAVQRHLNVAAGPRGALSMVRGSDIVTGGHRAAGIIVVRRDLFRDLDVDGIGLWILGQVRDH